jgi:hypothetical protein
MLLSPFTTTVIGYCIGEQVIINKLDRKEPLNQLMQN